MNGFFVAWIPTALTLAALLGTGVLLVAGALTIATLLPHGHPLADRLRAFAGAVPRTCWQAARRLEALASIGLLLVGAVLAIIHA